MEVYSVARDKWSTCNDLNIARNVHRSCILGEKLYVSGGDEGGSIEVADCFKLIDGTATWYILSDRFNTYAHVLNPISTHKILILRSGDVSTFDTRKNTIKAVGTNTL